MKCWITVDENNTVFDLNYDKDVVILILFVSFKVPPMSEICLVPKTKFASQYSGLYIFTSTARMIRPVWNLATDCKEWIGTFEQVYMDICITPEEAIQGVRDQRDQDTRECSINEINCNLHEIWP